MHIKIVDSNLTSVLFRFLTIEKETLSFMPEAYAEYAQYLPLLVIMFLLSYILTPLIGHLANKYGVISLPGHKRKNLWNKYEDPTRHTHTREVPLLGGLAVVLPLLIISSLIFTLHGDVVYLLLGILILMVSGILDDKYNMPATYQFLFQAAAALFVSFSLVNFTSLKIPFDGIIYLDWNTIDFTVLGNPASLSLPGDILMIFWIIGFINAIRWSAGVDALMEGNLIVAFGLMYIVGIRTGAIVVALVSLMLVGGLSGFIVFNLPPAKIYSGSVGKTIYGFIAASLAIIGNTKLATSTLILLLPIADAIYVVIRRYFKHRPKNPFEVLRLNGRDHLHHQLVDIGLSKKQILLVEGSLTLLIGSIAVLIAEAYRYFMIVFIVFILVGAIAIMHLVKARVVKKRSSKGDKDTPESKYSY